MHGRQICAHSGRIVAYVVALAFGTVPVAAQSPQNGNAPSASVRANFDSSRWLSNDATIELTFEAPPVPASGRVAILIGDVDWTALFERTTQSLRYRPVALPLPSGEHTLVVYQVSNEGAWTETARFPIRVLTSGGFERAEARPAIDIVNQGQLKEGHEPEANEPGRKTFQDLSFNLGLGTSALRNGWTTSTQVNVIGVTKRNQALRFGERQEDAPFVDLTSYQVSTQNNVATLTIGHIAFGGHRHLFNSLSSRGTLASFKFGPRADLALTAMNGSAIVGWNNISGLQEADHRVVGATAGVEIAPRPGAFRLEASVLNAKRLPRSGITQGAVTDAESNRGLGLRIVGADAGQRFRIDGGLARTQFGNPVDPLLAQGTNLVPVHDESRLARYLDVSYSFLQSGQTSAAGKKRPASLTAGFRHELVQPLFGSIGSFVRADVLQNVVDLNGTIGAAAFQASASWSHDNLDRIASILETSTRVGQVNIAVPLASVASAKAGPWLPAVTYTLSRTHQFGAGLPPNSDFQESHVPDQLSTNQLIGVEWQQARWRAGYRFNHSLQDNRQVGRVTSDLANLVHNISAGVTPDPRIDFGVDLAFEGAENREVARTDATRRVGVTANWRPTARTVVGAMLSTTFLRNDVDTARNRNTDLNLQFTQGIPLSRRTSGKPLAQVFVRYARQSARSFGLVATQTDARHLWTINTGLTLSVF